MNDGVNTADHNFPVYMIDTPQQLEKMLKDLAGVPEISIDTEFDCFNQQYGIHLQLVQVFDGSTCFLVDPLGIRDLSGLWSILEDRSVLKVVYSGANDVDVLKRSGCSPVHLFDIQIAAALCEKPERSLSAVLEKKFGVRLSKSIQSAGWGNRPLKPAQLQYASTDVVYLLQLKEMLMNDDHYPKIEAQLREQNKKLEAAYSRDYYPRLTQKQSSAFSKYSRQKLLELKILVDDFAQQLNLPPFKIVPDAALEAVIKNPGQYADDPFRYIKFHYKVVHDVNFAGQLMALIRSIDPAKKWKNERPRRSHQQAN